MGNESSAKNDSMRNRIRAINRDETLTPAEKNRRIQALYNENRPASPASLESSHATCEHYHRQCEIKAVCCGKWYPCRLCHNEAENHEMDRKATKRIRCVQCRTKQKVSNSCRMCGIQFGEYFCAICRLWTDGDVYHCDKCGICRKGTVEENVHCDTCGMCMK